jgi:hippurate hydrolase
MHENPQTAYEEQFASDLVSAKLSEWGIEHERHIGITGIVAKIESTKNTSGKAIGIRADMDALDIFEKTNQPWSSKIPGKMHGCGHDGHTSILLGVAKHLSETKNFDGTVYLIFQPAEEGQGGADKMIKDGLFKKYPMDAVFGLHNWPFLKKGKVALRSGPMLASADKFSVVVHGKGGHAAYPEQTIDPIITANKIISEMQTIISRELKPTDPAVLSITNMSAGTGSFNVIPDTAEFSGTIRVFSEETRAFMQKRVRDICNAVAGSVGAKADIEFEYGMPPTINSKQEAAFCTDILIDMIGLDNVDTDVDLCMGSEDFGSMLLECPGAYVFMGQAENDNDSQHNQSLHSPHYDFNDDIIPIGIEYFTRIAESYLK